MQTPPYIITKWERDVQMCIVYDNSSQMRQIRDSFQCGLAVACDWAEFVFELN